jgi:alpha-ribazole phosphatase
MTTRWWWLRHAPVTGLEGVIYGQQDVPCNVGEKAAFCSLAEALPDDAVWVASPLSRTKDTAQALFDELGTKYDLVIEPDLMEQNFGLWQGLKWDDFKESDDPQYRDFWKDAALNRPPEGESFSDVIKRVTSLTKKLNEKFKGRDIIAVAHGGSIRAALALALEISPLRALSIKIDPLSLTRIDHMSEDKFSGVRVAGVNRPFSSESA